MNWAGLSKPLVKLAAQLAAALFAYQLLRSTGFYDFTAREAEGLNTLILLMGNIYAVMFAFVIFVIWGQFTEVENFVMRECNALNDLLRFSRYMNADISHAVRHAVANYSQRVVNSEWQALADRQRDSETEKSFAGLMNAVMKAVPVNSDEEIMRQRLIDITRKVGEHRDERIAKSLSRIPPTLSRFVRTLAVALLLLVFIYPFHHWVAGMCCFFVVALVLFLANLVMTDTDNPFKGVCNVSPQRFSELTL